MDGAVSTVCQSGVDCFGVLFSVNATVALTFSSETQATLFFSFSTFSIQLGLERKVDTELSLMFLPEVIRWP